MNVVPVGQHFAYRGHCVPPGSSDFLAVVFNRFGQIIMKDLADILLVDSHPESDGCHDTSQGPLHEFVLNLLPFLIFHSGMIRMRIYFIYAKELCDIFSRFLQGDINNGRVVRCFLNFLKQAVFFFRIIRRRYLQKEIVAIKSGDKHIFFKNIKFSAHVVSDLRCCRRSQQQRLLDFKFLLIRRQF